MNPSQLHTSVALFYVCKSSDLAPLDACIAAQDHCLDQSAYVLRGKKMLLQHDPDKSVESVSKWQIEYAIYALAVAG